MENAEGMPQRGPFQNPLPASPSTEGELNPPSLIAQGASASKPALGAPALHVFAEVQRGGSKTPKEDAGERPSLHLTPRCTKRCNCRVSQKRSRCSGREEQGAPGRVLGRCGRAEKHLAAPAEREEGRMLRRMRSLCWLLLLPLVSVRRDGGRALHIWLLPAAGGIHRCTTSSRGGKSRWGG